MDNKNWFTSGESWSRGKNSTPYVCEATQRTEPDNPTSGPESKTITISSVLGNIVCVVKPNPDFERLVILMTKVPAIELAAQTMSQRKRSSRRMSRCELTSDSFEVVKVSDGCI